MYPLIFTISLLSLLGIMTSSAVSSYFTTCKERYAYSSTLKTAQVLAEVQVKEHLHAVKNQYKEDLVKEPAPKIHKQENKRRSRKLEFDLDRPSNNSRLNFFLLLQKDNQEKTPLSHYEIAARLMRRLYEHTLRFQSIPRAEYKILDALLLKKEETSSFIYPDQLAEISFDDPFLTSLFHQMLKGGLSQNGDVYPSLLHYITFDECSPDGKRLSPKTKRINLLFVPRELLSCIVPDLICDELCELRNQIWKEVLSQEANRKELEKTPELLKGRLAIEQNFTERARLVFERSGTQVEDYLALFDFSLGKIGNVWIKKDVENDIVIREKVINVASLKRKQQEG